MSDFNQWKSIHLKDDAIIYSSNIGEHLSIDETALSKDELYTIITNKSAKGGQGTIVAIFKGTQSEPIIQRLLRIPEKIRFKVKEITLDMAHSMKQIVKVTFPKAQQVTDRFHVQKLASEALQDIRIKYRWEAIDQENRNIKLARLEGKSHKPALFSNGDSRKQLLARSRHLLYKSPSNWTESQQNRAEVLFEAYPDIQKAYRLSNGLRTIFNQNHSKQIAYTKLAHWYRVVEESGFKAFNSVARTIHLNYQTILNYFDNRSTNASAESFNAKIKAFRYQFRGVKDPKFFLFRLTKIFA